MFSKTTLKNARQFKKNSPPDVQLFFWKNPEKN
jgi:hypothetical protein